MHYTCDTAGAPVEEQKSEGPATTVPFLGIEIDSIAMELRLPGDKLSQLKQTLRQWRGKKSCLKRDLLSIIGSLSHASKSGKVRQSLHQAADRLVKISQASSPPCAVKPRS